MKMSDKAANAQIKTLNDLSEGLENYYSKPI